ncbi:MAG: glucose dehydrogenase [Chloroflexi bacterium]|nr:MAG: glucose dehydrogenase [Chloroflexota bacterium]MBL1196487.1 glucose dehydrogenase [Chloroflexota bacterium]
MNIRRINLLMILGGFFLICGCQPIESVGETSISITVPMATFSNQTPTLEPTETLSSEPNHFSSEPIVPVPDINKYQWRLIAEGFDQPTVLTHAGDGSQRLFVAEKTGRIHIIADNWVNVEPFLDIHEKVFTEQNAGLLGLTFHPNFEQNGFFFVYYVNQQRNSVVARYTVSQSESDKVEANSEQIILEIDEGQAGHYAGTMTFGPDGYLYIGVGDGGLDNAELENNSAQDINSLKGKILRIDVSQGLAHSVPEDNLFVGKEGRDEIWALGLRNPWGFSFDRETGEMFVADPGHNAIEEINYLPGVDYRRRNFSWNFLEGSQEFLSPLPSGNNYIFPIYEYGHEYGFCSTIGGQVYRGVRMPEWQGFYIFGDFCQGDVWAMVRNFDGSWSIEGLARFETPITAFGTDESGEVYLLSLNGGVRLLAPNP